MPFLTHSIAVDDTARLQSAARKTVDDGVAAVVQAPWHRDETDGGQDENDDVEETSRCEQNYIRVGHDSYPVGLDLDEDREWRSLVWFMFEALRAVKLYSRLGSEAQGAGSLPSPVAVALICLLCFDLGLLPLLAPLLLFGFRRRVWIPGLTIFIGREIYTATIGDEQLVQQRRLLLDGACNRDRRHYTQVRLHYCVAIEWCSAFGNWHIADPNAVHPTKPRDTKRQLSVDGRTWRHRHLLVCEDYYPTSCEPTTLRHPERSEVEKKKTFVRRGLPLVFDERRVIEAEKKYDHECCLSAWDKVRNVGQC